MEKSESRLQTVFLKNGFMWFGPPLLTFNQEMRNSIWLPRISLTRQELSALQDTWFTIGKLPQMLRPSITLWRLAASLAIICHRPSWS